MHPPLIKQWTLPSVADLHAATLRLLGLLAAQRIESDLLQEGIDALAALIGARYAAIALLDEAGNQQQVICSGLSPE